MGIINDNSLAREDKIQKIRALRETTITKARSLLNDAQQKKLDAMLQESDRMRQQQQGSSPSSTQPGTTPPGASTQPGTTPPSTSTQPAGTPPARPPQ
jgi:hypothetical protein